MAEVTISNKEGYRTEIRSDGHVIISDEPVESGGSNDGMSPYEILLSALGSCTAITMRMYAERKKFSLKDIYITLTHNKIHAEDCADCETKEGRIDTINVEIRLTGNLSDEQREQIFEISKKCPVNRTLSSEIIVTPGLIN